MASTLDRGSIAALSYGNKVPALIYSLFATALGTAVLPYFSEMVARNDWSGCRHTLMKYSQLCLLTLIPLMVVLYFCSGTLIRLIFQRGSFDVHATELVVGVQQAYLLQVPSYVVAILVVRLISASGHNHILSVVAVFSFLLNIFLNWWFMNIFGVKGIALSTSAVQLVTVVTLFYFVTRLVKRKISIRHDAEMF
jgi:putative peptidoglycan lipid II flippase